MGFAFPLSPLQAAGTQARGVANLGDFFSQFVRCKKHEILKILPVEEENDPRQQGDDTGEAEVEFVVDICSLERVELRSE